VPPRAALTRAQTAHEILLAENPDHMSGPIDNWKRGDLVLDEDAACPMHRCI